MSVLIVTSLGDIVIDLHTEKCPLTCKNFLKLCKIKYYNGCLFHTVQKDFTAQTGDPTGTGSAGDSIYRFLYGDQARFFSDEIHLDLKHSKTGTVAMASAGENVNASQFYITLRDDLDYLDGKHTVFGEVAEGLETLTRINEAYVDEKSRPYKNIRIKHTNILYDPFDDPPQLAELIPPVSPEGKPKDEVDDEVRLEDDWVPMDEQLGASQLEEVLRAKEAHSRAVVLESIGDIPDAEVKPPENVLFVCKLNPVTEDEDLHTIFSRFGTVVSADIIRDYKTGDSLCYAFVEFETNEACEEAYFKMDNALIDDRRIHVDFSQSVAKLWSQHKRKDNQFGKGSGCFKCGAPDHMAKDCSSEPGAKQQVPKYILKDDDNQRGDSRYEMVFDEDSPKSPRREKTSRTRNQDNSTQKYTESERRKVSDGYRTSTERREHKEDGISEAGNAIQSSGSRRDRDEHVELRNRNTDEHGKRQKEREDDRRNDQTYRHRGDDYRREERKDARVDKSKRSDYGDRNVDRRDNKSRDSREEKGKYLSEKRDKDDNRKREERDDRKRDSDVNKNGRGNEPSHRKRSTDDDDGYRHEGRARQRQSREEADYNGDQERRQKGERGR